jgi:tetratricopeptide (TPR) repeat protein
MAGLGHRLRNLPTSAKRLKLWIFLGVFLIILLALGPWIDLVLGMLKGVWTVFLAPILESEVGRFVFVNALGLGILWFLYLRFRERGRRLMGSWALDRFLSGLLHLSSGRYRRAARSFESVVRVGRWVDLKTASPVYPEVLADSRIKLALCYREMGEVDRAMKSLELLKVRDLSPARKKDHAEAKAFVYALSGELMEETVDREIVNALETDGGNRRLLRLKRDRAEQVGDLPAAIDAQRRILKAGAKSERPPERTHLAGLHARNALRLLTGGRAEDAMAEVARSRGMDPTLVVPNLVAGDIALHREDRRGAVREWARTPSLPSLERIRKLLQDGELSSHGDLEFLAEAFPRSGLLLVLAEDFLRRDELRLARNCIAKHDEVATPNRHSAHLMAAILRAEGDEQGAERMEWTALKGFLGADRSADSVGPERSLR